MNNFYLFPLLKSPDKEPGYFIRLNAITLYQQGDFESRVIIECTVAAQLDISISVATLPRDILLALYGEIGQLGIDPIMPCEMLKEYKVGFVFSGVEYLIPMVDIVTQRFNNGEDCAAPFVVAPHISLGANVLSVLYMVLDVDREEIALAFARTSKEVELGEHAVVWVRDTIPARRAPNFTQTVKIRNTFDIRVSNINYSHFTPWKSRSRSPKTTKTPTTITVTHDGGTSTGLLGPTDSAILAR